MYKVLVIRPTNPLAYWPWASTYFPRGMHYLRDAKKLAQSAIDHGASQVRIKYPNGAEPGDCHEVGGVL